MYAIYNEMNKWYVLNETGYGALILGPYDSEIEAIEVYNKIWKK